MINFFMKIAYLLDGNKTIITLGSDTIIALFEKLGFNQDDYIVTRDDEVLIDDDLLNENDLVKLHKVWSGG